MKCPYCSGEMELGIIQSPQEISWKKGLKRPFAGRAKFHPDSVVLSELSFMKGSAVKAYLCRNCRKVIIDLDDPKSDMNQK